MAASSYLQDSFLGGQWSPYYQGRFKDELYASSMAVCLNTIPLEEGAAGRRPGTNFGAYTRGGVSGVLHEFQFVQSLPYNIEFTPGHARFWFGASLVLEPTSQNVIAISTATPAVIETAAPHNWSTGDEVQFNLPAAATDNGTHLLYNRQFLITVLSDTTFSIADSVTNASVPGTDIVLGPLGTLASRILDLPTPYVAADLPGLRIVQTNEDGVEAVVVLSQGQAPQQISAPTNPDAAFNTFATFAIAPVTFVDGPYLDPVDDGGTVTPSALTGIITLTVGYEVWSSTTTYAIADTVIFSGVGYISLIDSNLDNEPDTSTAQWQPQSAGASVSPSGFVATDVGRSIRLFSQPAAWSKTAAYAKGATVEFDGSFWTALIANTGNQPGLDVVNWGVDTAAAAWTWGRIQTVISATEVTLQLLGGPLLYTTAIDVWQVGRYSVTTGWPTVGVYEDGRLWLAGYQYPNHFDGSMSDLPFQFSPSGLDGTVADDNGISETLNSSEANPIYWMIPDSSGIVMGTQEGEWLIQASALNDPLTPTSIQSNNITHYGSQPVEPKRSGITFQVVQRYAKKMLEFMLNVYSGKYEAQNLALKARNLTTTGIEEIAYQRERTPIVWTRMTDGSLSGMTYKRERSFQTNGPTFAGWHTHVLGSGRKVTSIQVAAAPGGDVDTLSMVTTDGTLYWVEILTNIADEEDTLLEAWNLDAAVKPWGAETGTVDDVDGVYLYGYYYLAGQTITVWGGGLDLGDFTVAADGSIFVPFGSDATNPNGYFGTYSPALFTADYLATLAESGNTYNNLGLFVNDGNPTPPGAPDVSGISEFTGNTYASGSSPLIDWKNQVFYLAGEDSMSNTGISAYSMPGIVPIGSVSATTLGTGVGAGIVGADHNLYYFDSADNSGPYAKVSPGLSLLGHGPGTGGSSESSSSGGMSQPGSNCAVSCFHQYIIQTSDLTSEIAILDGTTMKFAASLVPAQAHGGVCAGRQTNDGLGHYYGEAYSVLDNSFEFAEPYIGATGNTPWVLWRTTINTNLPSDPVFAFTSVASITPQDIDPNWLVFGAEGCPALAFDTTDGNVLFWAVTGDLLNFGSDGNPFALGTVVLASNGHAYECILSSGSNTSDPTTDAGVHWTDLGVPPAITNTTYLCKANSATGAVMWTMPFTGNVGNLTTWNQSLIENGRVAFMLSSGVNTQNVYWVDTITPAIVETLAIQDVGPGAQQMWGSTVGLIQNVVYTDSGGPPTPVPVPPATGSFSGWSLFKATPAVPTQLFGPFVCGYTYTSEGEILRPIDPNVSGARNGPALGKTRRTQETAYLLHNTSGVLFGVDFDVMRFPQFKGEGPQSVAPLTPLELYSDIFWDKVDSDYNFNSQPCWRVTRPYPITVLAVEAFLETQDR